MSTIRLSAPSYRRTDSLKRVLISLLLLAPAASAAQVLRGTVRDRADQPVSGVVVTLVDSTESVRARALSDDRGEYSIRAPHPGTFRLRALRIGYRPVLSRALTLSQGQVLDERLVLDGVRVTLAAVRVVGRSACGRQPGAEASSVFSAWDQAMTSIVATSLTSTTRALTVTTMQIERTLEPNARRVRAQAATVSTDYVKQPWRSLPAEMLRRRGYAEVDAQGGTTYHAPGLDVLSSPQFLDDHCLRLVVARDTSEIGVAFEPNMARWRNAEIRGTLWMARSTAELRRLEFTYTNVPELPPVAENVAGGAMAFTRLRDGTIVISRWEIRMPQMEKTTSRAATVRVAEIRSIGGELVVARRTADTLFKRPTLAVSGTVLDSLSGRVVARAIVDLVGTAARTTTDADGRFTLGDVLPGEYTIAVRTPSLDSIGASSRSTLVIAEGMPDLRLRVPTADQLALSLCGRALLGVAGRGLGAVLGTVRDLADGSVIANTRVVADWTEASIRTGPGATVTQRARRMETRTDPTGAFRLCGTPTETVLTVQALPDSGRSSSISLRLSPAERFETTTLTVDRARPATATFRGVVQEDSSRSPLGDVEILLPDLSLSARTDESGAFRIAEIPVGTHPVVVRRVGYGALDTLLTFAPNDEEERRIILSRLTVLAEVSVIETALDPAMREFEENRRLGLGHFLTREDLEKFEGRRMSETLGQLPGAGIVGSGTRGFLLSKRRIASLGDAGACVRPALGSPVYVPSRVERSQGLICACYAQVYLDGVLMNPGKPAEPFDVNSIPATQIESIEWYASPAQTPSQYAGLNSACGVYVIHRRRNDDSHSPGNRSTSPTRR